MNSGNDNQDSKKVADDNVNNEYFDVSSHKGNRPELWNKLLGILDEKLQFGLLDKLKRTASYHFENNILQIEPSNKDDYLYLVKPPVIQTLKLFVQDVFDTSFIVEILNSKNN